MRAFRVLEPNRTGVVEVDRPEPEAHEVVVKVAAAGVCHSDVFLQQVIPGLSSTVPWTLGHEVAGWVDQAGSAVDGFEVGETVAIYQLHGCGTCRQCLRGADNLCPYEFNAVGVTRDGGLAEYCVMPARNIVKLRGLDMVSAAVLTDAGLTAYGAISHATDLLVPGSTAVVIGIGGLGHVGVQILSALTPARIIAVDIEPSKLALARRVGAHDTVLSHDGADADISELVGPSGVDAVFDFVANDATLAFGAKITRMGGAMVLTGMGFGSLTVATGGGGGATRPEVRIVRTLGGTRTDLEDCFALARRGLINVEATTHSLDETADVLAALDGGSLVGRGVILPNG